MQILLLGSGGREHAFASTLKKSLLCEKIFIAPGNAGTALIGENVPIKSTDFESIKSFVISNNIQMVIPCNEDPLVAGIIDFFKQDTAISHIPVIGPSQAGAQLEGSKSYAKAFMQKYKIPTAGYKKFTKTNFSEGIDYLKNQNVPIVLKADGLAAGKGVVIAQTQDEALEAFTSMIQENKFGEASSTVVIEDFLSGIECSVFVLTDGNNYHILPTAKDYKRIGEKDSGLNTGGMGAIAPVPFADAAFMKIVQEQIIDPTIKGLQQEQIDYIGFIYFGLINVQGKPYVIEYNCRMGDPETQAVLPLIQSDLLQHFIDVKNRNIKNNSLEILPKSCATVVLVSKGYPETFETNKIITAASDVLSANSNTTKIQASQVFYAGVKNDINQIPHTAGGRVMAISSIADNLSEALQKSYATCQLINYENKFYRNDIGYEFL